MLIRLLNWLTGTKLSCGCVIHTNRGRGRWMVCQKWLVSKFCKDADDLYEDSSDESYRRLAIHFNSEVKPDERIV